MKKQRAIIIKGNIHQREKPMHSASNIFFTSFLPGLSLLFHFYSIDGMEGEKDTHLE
jgi:hypothetical protein